MCNVFIFKWVNILKISKVEIPYDKYPYNKNKSFEDPETTRLRNTDQE